MPSTAGPFPEPDVTHATPAVAELLTAYHRAKWDHDVDAWTAFFAEDALYADATLGYARQSRAELRAQLDAVVPGWGDGRSWATRVIGNDDGAVVAVTDDPQLFGGEIRALSAVVLRDGAIVRFVDHWDSRHFGTALAERMRVPDDAFPPAIETAPPDRAADPAMNDLCRALHAGLAGNDPDAVAGLLGRDVVWEDLTLHAQVVGPAAVRRYLERCAGRLPYATGSEIVTVLGGALGGGWEWRAPGGPVRGGIVAVELDGDGAVSRLTAVWDGGRLPDDRIAAMTAWSVEPSR